MYIKNVVSKNIFFIILSNSFLYYKFEKLIKNIA